MLDTLFKEKIQKHKDYRHSTIMEQHFRLFGVAADIIDKQVLYRQKICELKKKTNTHPVWANVNITLKHR